MATTLDKVTICGKGSPYVTTYTGKKINLLDEEIDPDCIDLEDIAWALSRNNRWNSMTETPITVAVHSMYAAELVVTNPACKKIKKVSFEELRALLHDAAEAYITDLPRPIKYLPQLSFYLDIEHRIEVAIAKKMGLESIAKTERCAIADNILLANESVMYRPNSESQFAYEILDKYNVTPFVMRDIYFPPDYIYNHFLDKVEEFKINE